MTLLQALKQLRVMAASGKDIITKLITLYWFLRGSYGEWKENVWERDLDRPYCCDGYMCGCQASTVREVFCTKR